MSELQDDTSKVREDESTVKSSTEQSSPLILCTPQPPSPSNENETPQFSSSKEEDFKTPNVLPRPTHASTIKRTAVKMLDMSRSPIVPKPQSLQVSTIPFAGRVRCKTTENSIALKGRLFVKMNQLSSSSSLFEGEYQYRIDSSSSSSTSISGDSQDSSSSTNSSNSMTSTQKVCASCGKIPDLGHARVCIHCNVLHCKYCKGTEMKKLGPKQWIHPRCAENRSRSGACEMCGDTLQPNSPTRKKLNTISRFMTPRKKRMRNQIQCQLCGLRYCMSCYSKIRDTMKRVQSNDDRWIHLKCEERLLKRQISSRSQDREWSSSLNRISGSLYPCTHTPGMILVTMAVFLNEYEDDLDDHEQCVVVLSGLTNRSLKGVCELHGTCVSRRLAPHGVRV